MVFSYNIFLKSREVVLFQKVHDGIAVGLGLLGPVGTAVEMRYR